MPFKSENQRRYLWAEHPEIARRWSKEYGSKVAIPPQFQKGKQKTPDKMAEAKTEAAKRRLAMMAEKKPKGK